MTKFYNIVKLKERRRTLRKEATKQENLLWWYLRDNRLGQKFRRQASIGGYILDFYCQKIKLIIEVDGEIHNKPENILNDKVRDKYFTDLGYKILRFLNSEVEENINQVLNKIRSVCV